MNITIVYEEYEAIIESYEAEVPENSAIHMLYRRMGEADNIYRTDDVWAIRAAKVMNGDTKWSDFTLDERYILLEKIDYYYCGLDDYLGHMLGCAIHDLALMTGGDFSEDDYNEIVFGDFDNIIFGDCDYEAWLSRDELWAIVSENCVRHLTMRNNYYDVDEVYVLSCDIRQIESYCNEFDIMVSKKEFPHTRSIPVGSYYISLPEDCGGIELVPPSYYVADTIMGHMGNFINYNRMPKLLDKFTVWAIANIYYTGGTFSIDMPDYDCAYAKPSQGTINAMKHLILMPEGFKEIIELVKDAI